MTVLWLKFEVNGYSIILQKLIRLTQKATNKWQIANNKKQIVEIYRLQDYGKYVYLKYKNTYLHIIMHVQLIFWRQ
jgi:hypothetical protein